jgi:hypothetical protein
MILVIALIFLVVLSLMGIAAIMTSTSTTSIFGGLRRADEALYNAEAGIEAARRIIAQENPNFDQVYADGGKLPGLGNIDGVVVCGNGSYQVRVINDESDDGGPTRENNGIYIIRSTGIVGDAVKTLEVVVESFSRFFYFSQYEEAPGMTGFDVAQKDVYFRTGDEMDGPVHSNYALRIAGEPHFYAMASSNESPVKMNGSASDDQIFLGGTNWSRTVSLPVGPDKQFGTSDDLDEVYQGALVRGKIYDTFNDPSQNPFKGPDPNRLGLSTEFRVHFQGDSGNPQATIYKLIVKDPDGTPGSGDENPDVQEWSLVETLEIGAGFNGVVYFHGGGTVHVGGKIDGGNLDGSNYAVSNSWVRGKWTIASDLLPSDTTDHGIDRAGPIQIDGDIKYIGDYSESSIFPIVADSVKAEGLLGLVSANNVWINYVDTIRSNGITIHASIMATCREQSGSFSADTKYLDPANMTPGKPLNLMGGTIQYYRGVVGFFDSGFNLTAGFKKNYKYDKRLYYMSPPSFPVAVNLKMKSWKE